jgi:hypothetical protein
MLLCRNRRAREFYEKTLGLNFISDVPCALVSDANGTTLRIQKLQEVVIAPYTRLACERHRFRRFGLAESGRRVYPR